MKHGIRLSVALALASALPGSAFAAVPATAPYYTDTTHTHVEDATSESIGTVNMIMCFMNGMQADALVNKPPYLALVDQNKCDPKTQSSSTNSGASGGAVQAADYMNATVSSTRASNTDPMRVKVWFDDTSDNNSTTIFVNMSASAAPTTTNPYGVFRFDFCGKGDPTVSCMMQGYVEGKQDGSLTFFQTQPQGGGSGGGGNRTTQLALTPTGADSGSGSIQDTVNGSGAGFTFAYDANLYLRSNGTSSQCFSRDASDPATGQSVWRYGLYDSSTGEHVDRNSGFPITFTAAGKSYSGYLSYWGLSLQADAAAALTNGATVSKVDYSAGSAPTKTDYSVVKSGGKLTKYTKQTRSLRSLDQIRFNVWLGNEAATLYSGAQINTNYEMYWDDASGTFKVTGVLNCGNNGCETHTITQQTVGIAFWASRNGIDGQSNSLGGELFIDLAGVTDPVHSANVNVIYRVQDIVYPSNFPSALYCVRDCPTAASLSGYFVPGTGESSPFSGITSNNWQPTAPADVVTYTPSATDVVLKDGAGQAVVFTDAAALSANPQYQYGVRTGRMVTSLADAECQPGVGQYCDYKIQSADVYYVWETGSQPWNQFAAVKDSSGTFVTFDPPLQVNYAVPTGSQYGAYAGKTLVLEYGGFGQLSGLPGTCVSHDTNAVVSCDTPNSRYVPAFVIPTSLTDGVVTSTAGAGTTTYLVKWLDREIRFAPKDLSVCTTANLTLPTAVQLPDATGLKDPSDPASPIYIGVRPTVTDPVRVIQGDIKW